MRDAHKILSVGRNATMQDIKVAYRRLALQLHPDTNGGDAAKSEQFKRVNEAYSYLTDPKAKEYDIFDDVEEYASHYSTRSNHKYSSSSHWNPFQSPFQNMKNAQNAKKKNNSNPFGDFEEWDTFDFIDFESGEEIVFGFDKKGKAKSSRKQSSKGGKRKNSQKSNKKHANDDPFAEFTTEEIEDIIRNSTTPGWGSEHASRNKSSPNRRRSNSNSGNSSQHERNNSNTTANNNKGGKNSKKASRSRRRRRGGDGDDCTIS